MDVWRLRNLVMAYEQVHVAEVSYEEAKATLAHHQEIERWLNAERRHTDSVDAWLAAEKRWHITREDLNFLAAERGWIAMREFSPRLDGVGSFSQLSPVVQDRYAVFASAVLEE